MGEICIHFALRLNSNKDLKIKYCGIRCSMFLGLDSSHFEDVPTLRRAVCYNRQWLRDSPQKQSSDMRPKVGKAEYTH
jgi:hypothetical protein